MSSDSGDNSSPTPDSSSPPPPSPSSEESSPPPPDQSSPPPPDSSPPPSSPPPSSPPPSSPPPSSPPPSSPPPSSPPPSSSENQTSPPPPSSEGSSSPPPADNGSPSSTSSPPPPPPPPPPSPPSNDQQAFSPPPPPSHNRQLAPPTPKSSNSNDTQLDSNENHSSTPILIAFASGAGLLLLVFIVLAIVCSRKKKNKKLSEPPVEYYYTNQQSSDEYFQRPPQTQQYGGVQTQQYGGAPTQQYGGGGGEHVLNIPPPPAGVWGPPTPGGVPPQRVDSDASNSSFSGPVLPPPNPVVALGFNQSTFTFDELSAATSGFAQRYLLGQGGFGYVHKGVLPNGKEIAVKSLKSTGGQGDREFKAEVDTISRVHHRYLVSLVGYCLSDTQKLLVYEYVPNKTLDYHLHAKGLPVMEWDTRLKIALGAAKGLAYLHEDCHPRIIHRDIKGSNILLDNNFEAKVSDFGLAKFTQDTNTHVSTRVMGTFGYLAPEYASSGKLSEKSDVFSYGVVLLELITGRRPVGNGDYEEDSLAEWARPLCTKAIESGIYEGLVDPRLDDNYDKQEMARMVACAAASVRHVARRRPKMSYIVRVLEGDGLLDLLNQDGVLPGQSGIYSSSSGSGDYEPGAYSADMKTYKKVAYNGVHSEFGDTSEYGLNLSVSSSDLSSAEYGRRTGGSRMNSP